MGEAGLSGKPDPRRGSDFFELQTDELSQLEHHGRVHG
jgi:hypothetical protein